MFFNILVIFISLLSLNKAAQVRCRGGESMNLAADGYAVGDPHTKMYNSYWHHFQGDSNRFYYYMKPLSKREDLSNPGTIIDTGITVDTVGFNLIVAHTYYSGNRNVIKWFMIEVFDDNNIYQIYVDRNPTPRVGYITKSRNSRTVQDITAVTLTPINTGIKTFSSRFKLEYTISGSWMQISLKDQHCIDLGGSGISLDARFTSHGYHGGYYGQLYAKTHCYQCQITGYFGDYYNNGHKAYNCKTGVATSGLVNVFTSDKLSCLVENSEVIPPPPATPTNDWCADTTIEDKVKAACTTAFNTYTIGGNCCKTEFVNDCNDEQISCWTDTCAKIGNDFTTTPTDQDIQNTANTEMAEELSSMPECVPAPAPGQIPDREYCVGGNGLTYSNAETNCKSEGTELAIINQESDWAKATTACGASGQRYCWIGYKRDSFSDASFEWIDGSINPGNALNWGNWAGDEPSSVKNGVVQGGNDAREICVMIDMQAQPKSGQWVDIKCGNNKVATALCNRGGNLQCKVGAMQVNQKFNSDNNIDIIDNTIKNDIKFLTFGIGIGTIITLFVILFIRSFGNINKTKYQKINVVSDISSDAASSDDEIKV